MSVIIIKCSKMPSWHLINIFRIHENTATAFCLPFLVAGKLKSVHLSDSLVGIIILYITGKLVYDSSASITKWIF